MIDLKNYVIGIELGSTVIKAVMLDRDNNPVASGSFGWENKLVDGIWTYSMDDVCTGLRACYAELKADFEDTFKTPLTEVGAIGVSAMMHGYLPFDKDGNQLCEFRTWRNTITGDAVKILSKEFNFNVPQRWSIAHIYQAILNGEEHVSRVAYITTLAGYIHYLLTGEKVIGIGDASGMFPIDSETLDYDAVMVEKFDTLHNMPWKLADIMPKVLVAGESGGKLTERGARLLDPAGTLIPGTPFAPPEGDAGTGMAATNSVRVRTGNVSAGTSDFAMLVADHPVGVHREIDMVTTPDGAPVAMVHCNNCTSDINAWAGLFNEFAVLFGREIERSELFDKLFRIALDGDADCGGLLSYNYYSGEGVTDINEGRLAFLRMPDAKFTLSNFMRTHLYSALATLKIGLDILINEENVTVDRLYGHGGFFKTPGVGQRILSAVVNAPVSVMETAGSGGPYGMALLCGYMLWRDEGETLSDYLDGKVFANTVSSTLCASEEDVQGFNRFLETYKKSFAVEKTAVEVM